MRSPAKLLRAGSLVRLGRRGSEQRQLTRLGAERRCDWQEGRSADLGSTKQRRGGRAVWVQNPFT